MDYVLVKFKDDPIPALMLTASDMADKLTTMRDVEWVTPCDQWGYNGVRRDGADNRPRFLPTVEEMDKMVTEIRAGRRVAAIKEIRSAMGGATLYESKQFVDYVTNLMIGQATVQPPF